ncbi:nitroreductase family deazaflavin-dependent oxidoreductase [Streptomyces griseoviridis]|uniref:Deazaflavin-dependent oxidoreductase (Nitroreductase family) n=3 Tax=Streptomyces TaxID=1883 RepID=A0ABT9LK27_STRGD|nr:MULTISPECIES: nitroreductase family deazaflavin-dependent oxidoreductase [Streptomyces]MDP9684069.1 deazaflavin-dependent oxidoreductase (nitroreductase family) [Streptomyces griseoviridis]GGS27414.1 hypothetical protein GCM10010238_15190 [Streptomyces niveoruber]GGS84559.1 hypothetical protein GCM10010240_17490 [Streptomyces griseoviridis]GGU45645.1 hypothetical protein GCM10010259_40750 [Streptomyces daghestanicus]GHI30975.1 hypothetical protein Sdagh_27050 [Streptomyces daghestanicus]
MARTGTASRRARTGSRGRWRLGGRLSVLLFRAGLGHLLGRRRLLLHHTGRVSGRHRQAVLDVVACDPTGPSWTVAAGRGTRADWYRNLRRRPKTVVQSGNRHHAVTARFLTAEAGARMMVEYARRRPATARRLCDRLGLRVDGSEGAYRAAGRAIAFVRLDAD